MAHPDMPNIKNAVRIQISSSEARLAMHPLPRKSHLAQSPWQGDGIIDYGLLYGRDCSDAAQLNQC